MVYETFLYIVEFSLLSFVENFCIYIQKGYSLEVIFNPRFGRERNRNNQFKMALRRVQWNKGRVCSSTRVGMECERFEKTEDPPNVEINGGYCVR